MAAKPRARTVKTRVAAPSALSPAKQVAGFISKYDPAIAKLARASRAALRKRLPTAVELVYDNYQALAIGLSATERVSDLVATIAVFPKSVILGFYWGSTLPDPTGILKGGGKQHRYVSLTNAAQIRTAPVEALIRASVAQARTPVALTGKGYTIIKSISAKQRPRSAAKPAPGAKRAPASRPKTKRKVKA